MLTKVLSTKLREQAGADTYNRFEYQVHWVVYHMIKEYKKGNEFLILCEFHDDMIKGNDSNNPNELEFYQIKTSITKRKWTMENLLKKTKSRNSFLGLIFYNFINFDNECSKCHFVSNIGINEEIALWQSIIKDKKNLKSENLDLYEKIKKEIKSEQQKDISIDFDEKFDKFIQNTYVYDGELPLEQYEKVVKGEFSDFFDCKKIYVTASNKILSDIIQDIRKKSKTKIQTPISLSDLKEKKAISSNIFKEINCKIDKQINKGDLYTDIEEYLKEVQFSIIYRKRIIRILKEHHTKILEINNSLYLSVFSQVDKILDEELKGCILSLEVKSEVEALLIKLKKSCERVIEELNIDDCIVEALLYEKLLSC